MARTNLRWITFLVLALGIASQQSVAAQSASTAKIYKCQSGSDTVYSDEKCLPTAQATELAIENTSGGFVSPDAAAIAASREKVRSGMQTEGVVAAIGAKQNKAAADDGRFCRKLAERIAKIDSASRVRSSRKSQQKLKMERQKLIAKQEKSRC